MTEATAPARKGEVIPTGDAPAPLRPEVVAAYESMIADVPDAGGDAFDSILGTIAQAADVADLDAPWRSAGLDDVIDRPLLIGGIRKMPSDFGAGLPWFLVVDAADAESGEVVTFTTGAVSVVAQLVKAWQMGAFPLAATLRQSARPSRSGYFPQHLEIARKQPARAS